MSRYFEVMREVNDCLKRCGRSLTSLECVIVSKNRTPEQIEMIFNQGGVVFGENRVLELIEKQALLPQIKRWHFIGTLQKNKLRKVVGNVELIHSVDSLPLAEKISEIAKELGIVQSILLQINISKEANKHGFSLEEIKKEREALIHLPNLIIEGVMGMPPLPQNPEDSRPYFCDLRLLKEALVDHFKPHPFHHLSMGMSRDFVPAIEEGATLLRVGSSFF